MVALTRSLNGHLVIARRLTTTPPPPPLLLLLAGQSSCGQGPAVRLDTSACLLYTAHSVDWRADGALEWSQEASEHELESIKTY